jgi:hypothetical protein
MKGKYLAREIFKKTKKKGKRKKELPVTSSPLLLFLIVLPAQ